MARKKGKERKSQRLLRRILPWWSTRHLVDIHSHRLIYDTRVGKEIQNLVLKSSSRNPRGARHVLLLHTLVHGDFFRTLGSTWRL